MKILHFISGIRGGGVEQMLINYTKPLNKQYGYNEVIVFQHDPDKKCLKKLEDAGNRCIRIPNKRLKPFSNLWETFKIIKKEKPDIVHCHMSLFNFFPLFIAKICGINIRISHSHISSNNSGMGAVDRLLKNLNIIFATNLVACGYDAGKYMYGKKKFKVIRNAINLNSFLMSKSDVDLKSSLNIPPDNLVIGHIGRFVSQKNHLRLIRIFYHLHKVVKNSTLILIGTGELMDKVKAYVNKLGLNDSVLFLGSIANVSQYYNIMDIFVLPSLYEGLPVVAIESQCKGIPTVLSDNIDNDAILLNTTKKMKLSCSDNQWINEIRKVASLKRYSVNERKRIFENNGFSIEKEFIKINDYYKKITRGVK